MSMRPSLSFRRLMLRRQRRSDRFDPVRRPTPGVRLRRVFRASFRRVSARFQDACAQVAHLVGTQVCQRAGATCSAICPPVSGEQPCSICHLRPRPSPLPCRFRCSRPTTGRTPKRTAATVRASAFRVEPSPMVFCAGRRDEMDTAALLSVMAATAVNSAMPGPCMILIAARTVQGGHPVGPSDPPWDRRSADDPCDRRPLSSPPCAEPFRHRPDCDPSCRGVSPPWTFPEEVEGTN